MEALKSILAPARNIMTAVLTSKRAMPLVADESGIVHQAEAIPRNKRTYYLWYNGTISQRKPKDGRVLSTCREVDTAAAVEHFERMADDCPF